MAQAQNHNPKVFVWTYEEGGLFNAPGAWTRKEDTKTFVPRNPDAVPVPTVVVRYVDVFREGQGYRWLSVKVVVVDVDEERFSDLVQELSKLIETGNYQPPLTLDVVTDAVHEIFEVNEYSSEHLRYEREGYSYERLVYMVMV